MFLFFEILKLRISAFTFHHHALTKCFISVSTPEKCLSLRLSVNSFENLAQSLETPARGWGLGDMRYLQAKLVSCFPIMMSLDVQHYRSFSRYHENRRRNSHAEGKWEEILWENEKHLKSSAQLLCTECYRPFCESKFCPEGRQALHRRKLRRHHESAFPPLRVQATASRALAGRQQKRYLKSE